MSNQDADPHERSSASSPAALGAWIELVKDIVEICAIVIVGWWTYTRFFQGEAPSLELRASADASLQWNAHGKAHCTATYTLTLKNIGRTSFDIDSVLVEAWAKKRPAGGSEIVHLDIEKLLSSPADDSIKIKTGSLVRHYAPDLTAGDGYSFIVPLDTTELAFFSLNAWGHASADHRTLSVDYTVWSRNCEKDQGGVHAH